MAPHIPGRDSRNILKKKKKRCLSKKVAHNRYRMSPNKTPLLPRMKKIFLKMDPKMLLIKMEMKAIMPKIRSLIKLRSQNPKINNYKKKSMT